MMDSNINITSNIYIRSNSDIKKDRAYTQHITGADRLQRIQDRYSGLETIPFTAVQDSIVSQSRPCANARNGEKTHGAVMVNGVMKWVNRCEYRACPEYASCYDRKPPEIIRREAAAEDDTKEKDDLQRFIASLGIEILGDTVIFNRDKNPDNSGIPEEPSVAFARASEPEADEIKASAAGYQEVTEPDRIIEAPLETHIILNSGPGTGKTYTIIRRLIYLLANQLCEAEEICILCYTRSAKRVIESKIEEAVTKGQLQPSARNICILTFDSYATYFLMAMKEKGYIREELAGYDYNDRIRLFNRYASAEDFESIRYFIVDEIQDLVNDRAQMVLHILKHLKCGYLLAGDRCQSIYDYEADADATLDSVRFYQLAEAQFPADMQRYEIAVNRRQTPELAEASASMRQVLLNESISRQNACANEMMHTYLDTQKIEAYIKKHLSAPSVPTAILCRSNGEAEYVSSLLCESGIRHTLNRGVNNTAPLPGWIAAVFWDDCRDTINKGDFIERCRFRCQLPLAPEEAWAYFCKMTNAENAVTLSKAKLTAALTMSNAIPDAFYETPPLLTVSTIHKAKGSEFDQVILLESCIPSTETSAEEARVRYVALTRPRRRFVTMRRKSAVFRKTASGRSFQQGYYRLRSKQELYRSSKNRSCKSFCQNITLGLTGDVDSNAFASGDFGTAVALQEYIWQHVKVYDKLTAERSDRTGTYKLMHNGHCIGTLSGQMEQELRLGVSATDMKKNLPVQLENLYVSAITTEILRKFSDAVPVEFQKSGICFGIQITGLAKLLFEKK